jgi:coenzyme F420 hydrogenase subunit beta
MDGLQNRIVKNGICAGCGVCVGICPKKRLEMQLKGGCYIPVVLDPESDNSSCEKCRLCEKACPVLRSEESSKFPPSENQTNRPLKTDPDLGHFLDTYNGYAPDYRSRGASGGMTSWLLSKLLAEKKITHAICCTRREKKPFRQFHVCDSEESIRDSAGSSYYPVEASRVIRHIIDNPGTYAITTLPCLARGLRLAMRHNRILRERLRFILTLTCGQQKTTSFTDLIAIANGRMPNEVKGVDFRIKQGDQPASNYALGITVDGKIERTDFCGTIAHCWTGGFFMLGSCSFCEDTFGYFGDITLMDTWLPDFSSDPRGHSLCVVRNEELNELLQRSQDELFIEPIDPKKIVESQLGVVERKRYTLPARAFCGIQEMVDPPDWLAQKGKGRHSDRAKRVAQLELQIARGSGIKLENLLKQYPDGPPELILKLLLESLAPLTEEKNRLARLGRITSPRHIYRAIRQRLARLIS